MTPALLTVARIVLLFMVAIGLLVAVVAIGSAATGPLEKGLAGLVAALLVLAAIRLRRWG